MGEIRIAVAGVGNCASALVQGIEYYKSTDDKNTIGLMHREMGGYEASDISVKAAFDVDERKVGKDVSEAVLAAPNCTMHLCDAIPATGVQVQMGPVMDGVAEHMRHYPDDRTFVPSRQTELTRQEITGILKETAVHILMIYLPVGSEKAARFYAQCALDAGVGLINNIPVFIASDSDWSRRFAEKGIPLLGDDIKSQVGATIVHRTLVDLFKKRGAKLDRTYQLNIGGNTDFLNMLDRFRLESKKTSKTEAVQTVAAERLDADDIHVGPSDYVPWQKDNKICFIRMEGRVFGNAPVELELRLSVEDSPNSAGVGVDAIRCCKLALDRGIGGVLHGPSAYFMKHPPKQYTDEQAYVMTEEFIRNAGSTHEP
jgi:myo-inositol-1-phosphate synthase